MSYPGQLSKKWIGVLWLSRLLPADSVAIVTKALIVPDVDEVGILSPTSRLSSFKIVLTAHVENDATILGPGRLVTI